MKNIILSALLVIGITLPNIVNAKINENITWEAGNDFAAGYFDVFYENNLFYAIPSVYANDLKKLIVDHKILSNCEREKPSEFNQLVTTYKREIPKGSSAFLYKNNEKISKLYEVSVDGINEWRFPTHSELQTSSYVSKLQFGLCNKYLPNGNRNGDALYSTLHFMTKDTIKDSGWSDNVMYRYKRGAWKTGGYSWKKGFVTLVRKPSKIEKKVFNQYSAKNYKKRIYAYAEGLTKEQTKVKKQNISKPSLLNKPSKPKLKKDEFETTATFNNRVENAIIKWKKDIAVIEQKNSDFMKNYETEKNNAELEYKEQAKVYSSKKYQSKIYNQSFEKALQVVLGKPYFKEIKYDADTQTMSGIVFSARVPSFKEKFKISVPIANAREFKDNLLNSKLIPMVKMDKNLKVTQIEVVTNTKKIEFEFTIAKGKHTISAYHSFINKYPKVQQVNEAKKAIERIEEKERIAEEKRMKEKKKREEEIERVRERKRQSYNAKKYVGDKVCKDGTTAIILSITITAYVERVNGNSIQLRISDTEGTSPHMNGVTLYRDTLIWDDYSSWYKCNY